VEIRHLKYAIAAAKYGSFRRAAHALGVQESAVSRRIRDVEQEVGTALFMRHAAGVYLTDAGQQFVRHSQRALDQIGLAAEAATAAARGDDGTVRVGIISSLASGFLADLFAAYNAKHSRVRLEFIEGGPPEHILAIRRHQLDIAFFIGNFDFDGCQSEHLWSERVFVAMSCNDPLVDENEITWAQLRGRHFIISEAPPGPEIQEYLIRHLAQLGHSPSIEQQRVYRDNLMQIVANGRGITLTSEATIAAIFPGVIYRPLACEILPFKAIWSPSNHNPALRNLLDLARVLSRAERTKNPAK